MIANELRDEMSTAVSIANLGMIDIVQDRITEAQQHLVGSLRIADRLGLRFELSYQLLLMGVCRSRQGFPTDGALLLGSSQKLFEDLGVRCEPFEDQLRNAEFESLRSSMGDEFDRIVRRGRDLPVEDAVALAMKTPTN